MLLGALTHILPGSDDTGLAILIHLEGAHGIRPEAVRRLAYIGGQDVQLALRLSNAEAKRLDLLREHMGTSLPTWRTWLPLWQRPITQHPFTARCPV